MKLQRSIISHERCLVCFERVHSYIVRTYPSLTDGSQLGYRSFEPITNCPYYYYYEHLSDVHSPYVLMD